MTNTPNIQKQGQELIVNYTMTTHDTILYRKSELLQKQVVQENRTKRISLIEDIS